MPFLAIDQLKPGMVLAVDVMDTNGRLLLSEGQSIAPKHMNIFKMWGVPEVQVQHTEGGEPENKPTLNPEAMRRVAEALKPETDTQIAGAAGAALFARALYVKQQKKA